MADIRIVDFNQLPRSTRERFVAITKNLAGPAPLFQERHGVGATAGWVILILLALGGLFVLVMADFGSLWRATQTPAAIVGYVIVFFFVLLAMFGILKSSRTSKALPFAPGTYAFPMDLVIAKDKMFKIVPMTELKNIQPTHHFRNGVYMRTTFAMSFSDGTYQIFSVFGQPQAQQMMERLKASIGQVDDAIARRDVQTLQALDPFFDARMSGWQPAMEPPMAPMATGIPGWVKLGWLFGLIGGILLGPVTWVVRNLASDQASFSKATKYDSAGMYEDYLHAGWLHTDEVQNDLLPHAKLKEAVATTSVAERITKIQEVITAYPSGGIRAEADKAMKDAIHAAFEEAKALNTVSALRDFQKKYPKADDVGAAKKRIHELFQKTLTDFRPKASTKDPNMLPFVESLLAYMEKNDSPAMEVRFRRHNAPSLERADQILASEGGGDMAAVSGNFDATDSGPRETAVVNEMKTGFGNVFPADVLPLAKGADFSTVTKAAVVTKPTILVDYTVAWSGSQYVDREANKRFVGVIIDFDVLMVIPNEQTKLDLKFSVRPPSHFTAASTTTDSGVYEVMALRAFDELGTKIQEKFFQPSKKPAPTKATVPDDDDDD